MPSTVIVALPEQDEPVWDYSSEPKPHLTLLYLDGALGENEEAVISFVQHAANTSLTRFGLSVDRRGTLGDDNADVLFFDTEFGVKQLREFRAMLLKNDEIAKRYVRADQFPGWVPHLTMGYPENPAKELPDDSRYMLNWINFDRIAVWTSKDDGPEFDLPRDRGMAMVDEAAWSEDHGVYIMHYGKKGMKWGVRKDVGAVATLRTGDGGLMTKSDTPPSRSDFKETAKVMGEVRAHMLRGPDSPFRPDGEMHKLTDKYNAMPGKPTAQRIDAYNKEAGTLITKYVNTKLPEGAVSHVAVRGDDALIAIGDPAMIKQWKEDLGHAADDPAFVYRMPLLRDENGYISGLDPDSEMEALDDAGLNHDAMSEDEYLEHYGRLGMKWGIRRQVDSSTGRVTGTVEGAIKDGQSPKAGESSVTKGKQSMDHKTMVKNADKNLESLSTAEIRDITARIKAVNDFKATTAAEKAKQVSGKKKIVDFALSSVKTGVQKKADSYIQELVGDTLEGLLPKTKSGLKRDAKDKRDAENHEMKKQDRAEKQRKEAQAEADKKSNKAPEGTAARDDAIKDLVYTITTLPDKED